MKSKKALLVFLVTLVCIGVPFYLSKIATAEVATSQGGGGESGCNQGEGWSLDTCYGATWRYYTIEETKAGKVPGATYNEGTDTIKIKGRSGEGDFSYAQEKELPGCKEYGGYYRYAMVAYATGKYNTKGGQESSNSYHKGDQVGVVGINNNKVAAYNSRFFGGEDTVTAQDASQGLGDEFFAMDYISPKTDNEKNPNHAGTTKEWDTVRQFFNNLPEEYRKNENGEIMVWGPNVISTQPASYTTSAIAAFCGPETSEVEGKSTATESKWPTNTLTTDWKKSDANAGTLYLNDHQSWNDNGDQGEPNYIYGGCYGGCEVKFSHKLRRISGSGDASYRVERTFNFDSKEKEVVKNETRNIGNETEVSTSSMTLYPGQTVCEELIFNNNTKTKVCATALGKVEPEPDYTGGNEVTKIRVWNKNGNDEYRKQYQGRDTNHAMVYAKPGDEVIFEGAYVPEVQKAYTIKPQEMVITWTNRPPSPKERSEIIKNNNNETLQGFFNSNIKALQKSFSGEEINGLGWKNDFTVYTTGSGWSNGQKREIFTSGNVGNTEKMTKEMEVKISQSNVGKDGLKGAITINKDTEPRYTPVQVVFYRKNIRDTSPFNPVVADVWVDKIPREASVIVPYNFINSVKVSSNAGNGGIVYAGEDSAIKATVTVGAKTNAKTTNGTQDEAYATVVRDAKISLIRVDRSKAKSGTSSYSGSVCGYYGVSNAINSGCMVVKTEEKSEISGTSNLSILESIPDVEAGTELCYAAAVYPANSGVDDNIDKKGSDSWAISDTVCVKVAKRPSFQVWGGSLYSSADIITKASIKSNLAGLYTLNNGNKAVFSSWVEQSVVANGYVKDLASGAATGATNNPSRPYGRIERDSGIQFCNYGVPLSLANYSSNPAVNNICPNIQRSGKSGIKITRDYDTTVKQIAGGKTIENNDGDYEISGGDFTNISGTRIIKNNGNIIIKSNVTYSDAAISSLENVPKLVLYTNGDITIDCGVGRVDAILIAKGEVNTCDNSDINSQENSNQLIINGMIIANNLVLNRTYGAGTGAASGIPAEIINYDTSTIVWGGMNAEIEGGSELTSVYQHELAPRY